MNIRVPKFQGFLRDPRLYYENVELVFDTPLDDAGVNLSVGFLLKEGESPLSGNAVIERAHSLGKCAGQRHAERLFAVLTWPYGPRISEPRGIYPGTIWRFKGELWIPCIDYSNCEGGGSLLEFRSLQENFGHKRWKFSGEDMNEPVLLCE